MERRKTIKRFFTATAQEWPWAHATRNILMLGLAACIVFGVIPLLNPPIPAYEELVAAEGSYQSLERRSDDSCLLVFEMEGGYTESCLIDSYTTFPRKRFLESVRPGDTIVLKHSPDDYQSVMELTAAGECFLTYGEAYEDAWNNNYLALVLSVVLTAAALVGCWLWLWLLKRRAQRDRVASQPEKQVSKRYLPGERKAVEVYIQKAYGKVGRIYYDMTQEEAPVDIAVIPPTEEADFYRLVTIGMGARRLEVPPHLQETNRAFAELAIFLPPDWDPEGEDSQWPFDWLRRMAGAFWVNAGSVFQGRFGAYAALLVGWPAVRGDCAGRLFLESGRVINFYQLLPLLPDEFAYYKLRGLRRLLERMNEYDLSPIVYPMRESFCDPEEWFEQEVVPFCIEKRAERWYAWLPVKALGPHYREEAYPRDSHGWMMLARRFCLEYGWDEPEQLELDCTPEFFYAVSGSEDLLRPFLLAFHDFCEDPDQVRELLESEEWTRELGE